MVGNSNAEEVLFHYTNTDKNISIVDFAGDTLVCLLCEKIADNANCTIRIEGLDDFTGTLIKDQKTLQTFLIGGALVFVFIL